MTASEPDISKPTHRVLSPTERLSEVIFGLIMVLSFTGSLSIATAERSEVREMFVGAIGCNAAWGIVDAVMYLLGIKLERGRTLVMLRAARGPDPARGRAAVAETLPPEVGEALSAEHLEDLRRVLARGPESARNPKLTLTDARGAIGVFLLVFLSTFPVVLPFAFLSRAHFALRLSNGVAIAMLFLAGFSLGRYAGLSPLRTGLVMVAVGAVLVGITIALGG
jgi:VIT1/CCC1 family predicted Fe2+/Mn2+ transporter